MANTHRKFPALAAVLLLVSGCQDDATDEGAVDASLAAQQTLVDWELIEEHAAFGERDAGAIAGHAGKLWILGGWTYQNDVSTVFTDVWSSADGRDWQLHPAPPWTFGMYPMAISFHNQLLMMGGLKNSRQPTEALSNEIWSSRDGDSWTLLGHAAWEPRIGAKLIYFHGNLWVLGGKVRNNADPTVLRNDVWRSEDGVNWTQVTANAPWSPRAFHCAFTHANEMWVIGGGDWDSRVSHSDVWHSSDGVHWTQETDAPFKGRIWHSCVSYDDSIWVMGGRTFDPIDTNGEIWRSTDGNEWELQTQLLRPDSRHAAYTTIFQNAIWTMGGSAHMYLQDDVWRYAVTSTRTKP
jgi:hypothetical protein